MTTSIKSAGSARTRPSAGWLVQVLGGFGVVGRRGPVPLSESCGKVVALLGLAREPLRRSRVGGALWADKDEEHAQSILRSTLWRINQVCPGLVEADGPRLALGADVRVDLDDLQDLAAQFDRGDQVDVRAVDTRLCCFDLLPDWEDAFVEDQRELVRQLRLRTLEAIARRLAEDGHFGPGLRLALTAVGQAPLRESSHLLVLEIHVAEGNVSEALRHYQVLKNALWEELGIRPSERLRSTMAPYAKASLGVGRPGATESGKLIG